MGVYLIVFMQAQNAFTLTFYAFNRHCYLEQGIQLMPLFHGRSTAGYVLKQMVKQQ